MYTVVAYTLEFLAAYIAITLGLFALSARMPKLEFYARLLAAYLSLIACAIYGVIVSIILSLFGYKGLGQWATARAFKWTMRYTTGVRFIIEGEENLKARPAVFVGNHQTELDILMLGTIFPPYCSVTAKKSLKYMPFLGWFMAVSGTVFIDRANRKTAVAAFDSAAQEMRDRKQSVYIFPEGTRSYYAEPDLLPFKKGAFHLAIQAQVPIVPVVVANYSNVLHVQSRRFVSGDIPVEVLPPIPTVGLTSADAESLTKRTRDAMLEELQKLTLKARSQGVAMTQAQLDGSAKATGVDQRLPENRKPAVNGM